MPAYENGTKVFIKSDSGVKNAGKFGTITAWYHSERPGYQPQNYNYQVMIKDTGKNVRISGEHLVEASKEEFNSGEVKNQLGKQYFLVVTQKDGRCIFRKPDTFPAVKRQAMELKLENPEAKVRIAKYVMEAEDPVTSVTLKNL